MKKFSACSLLTLLTLLVGMQGPVFAGSRHNCCKSASSSSSSSQNAFGSWQGLVNQPTFLQGGATNQLLLTDGSVLILDTFSSTDGLTINCYPDVWKLTPDAFGSYVNGTWSQVASLPMIPQHIDWPIQYACRPSPTAPNATQWAPFGLASAVLPDGRVLLAGGEDNGPNADFVLTNMCAVYDPVADFWTPVFPPPFIIDQQTDPAIQNPPRASFAPNAIGDSSGIILEDGCTFMLAPKMTNQAAYLNLKDFTWKEVGTRTNPGMNDEQFLVLLPDGNILTTECYNGQFFAPEIYGSFPQNPTNSLIFNPKTKTWKSAGSVIQPLTDFNLGEVGPAVLRPDGKVVVFGGTTTGQNVIFDSKSETWSVTRPFPFGPGSEGQLTCTDAAAALLPNGNILVCAAPYGFLPPPHFFEFTYDTHELIEQPPIPNAANINGTSPGMLILPTGQIMVTNVNTDVDIYTPGDTSFNPDWAPVVKEYPKNVRKGKTYKIEGIRFNGMSQGSAYGDDYQSATNYPLVRITNEASGHVFYCRTHDHSFMGVASDKLVHTYFDVPDSIERGRSTIEVVANGIPSKAKSIYVK